MPVKERGDIEHAHRSARRCRTSHPKLMVACKSNDVPVFNPFRQGQFLAEMRAMNATITSMLPTSSPTAAPIPSEAPTSTPTGCASLGLDFELLLNILHVLS